MKGAPIIPFEIIFEDENIIVINKLVKLLIQPAFSEKFTLTNLIQEKLKIKVFPCHRLDRETTGLIIYAKSKEMQEMVFDEFRRGGVKKKYFAFVKGQLRKKKGELADFIIDKEGEKFGEKRKFAKTIYRVIKKFELFSVLELEPVTGRTNQLRIQLAKIGNPILGERIYAFRRDFKLNFRRLALHSFFLSFIHPQTKKRLDMKIDLPKDMKEFLLRQGIEPSLLY